MSDVTRRDLLKGAAALVAVASAGLPTSAEAALPVEAVAAVKQWVATYTYSIRYFQLDVLKTDYALHERVMIKFLSGKNDKRKFGAKSLKDVNGKVIARIPSGAVPWRYIQNRADIPLKFRMKVKRSAQWQQRATGKLFAVKTNQGVGIVPAHRMRSRA